MNRGWIKRADAERLAAKWRVTLTPPSTVYKGLEPLNQQERLL